MRVVLILGLLLVTAAAVSWAAKIDIVAPTRGEVVARTRTREVQALETGVIAALHVDEGSRVRGGALLAELDERMVASEIRQIEAELGEARHTARRLRQSGAEPSAGTGEGAARGGGQGSRAAGRAAEPGWEMHLRLAGLEGRRIAVALVEAGRRVEEGRLRLAAVAAERERVEKLLPVVREQVDGLAKLASRSHASRHEYLRELSRRIEMEGRAESLAIDSAREEQTVARLEAAADLLRLEHDTVRQRELVAAQAAIAKLREDLARARRRHARHRVVAPVDGVVQDLGGLATGSFVRQGDRLMAVVPAEGGLAIRAHVLNRDVGFVKPGQRAIVKIDAFPFTRFGTTEGIVEGVSLDAASATASSTPGGGPEATGAGYLVRIALERPAIRIDGAPVPLRPGMQATVDIRTGRRRLLEYVIAPLVAYGSNAFRER